MKILGIDTSTNIGSIAIIEGDQLIAEYSYRCPLNYPRGHNTRLLPAIEWLCKENNFDGKTLDGIACAIGPGSFSGLRIGLATAEGLAYAWGIPLIGIPTLDGMVNTIYDRNRLICPLLTTPRGIIYTALYREITEEGYPNRVTDYISITIEGLLGMINEPVIFLGEILEIHKTLIIKTLGDKALFSPIGLNYPRAINISRVGLSRLEKGEMAGPQELIYPQTKTVMKG